MKESRPSPSFRPRFTSPATTPASPNPATFAKWRTWAVPSCAENSIRPRSQTSSRRPASERTAPSRSSGIPSVRRRSPPVPRGMKPKSGSGSRGWAAARPSITSLAVPSPPTATTSAPPERTASRASRTPSPGSFVKAHSNSPTADRTARAIRSKWRPVRPAALRGLTMRYGFTVVKDNRAWRSRPRPPSSPREHGEPAPAHVGSPRGPEFLGLWCMRAGCARLDPAHARLLWRNPAAARLTSDILVNGVLPAAVLLNSAWYARDAGEPSAFWMDALVLTEVAALTADVNGVSKDAVARRRPSAGRNAGGGGARSFFSGHTSFAFALATSAGTISTLRGYPSAPWMWAGGMAVATGVGYLRIAGDAHWLPDVVPSAAGLALLF